MPLCAPAVHAPCALGDHASTGHTHSPIHYKLLIMKLKRQGVWVGPYLPTRFGQTWLTVNQLAGPHGQIEKLFTINGDVFEFFCVC